MCYTKGVIIATTSITRVRLGRRRLSTCLVSFCTYYKVGEPTLFFTELRYRLCSGNGFRYLLYLRDEYAHDRCIAMDIFPA